MGWRNGAIDSLGTVIALAEQLRHELCAPELQRREPRHRLVCSLFALIGIEAVEGFGEVCSGCGPFPGIDSETSLNVSTRAHDALSKLSELFRDELAATRHAVAKRNELQVSPAVVAIDARFHCRVNVSALPKVLDFLPPLPPERDNATCLLLLFNEQSERVILADWSHVQLQRVYSSHRWFFLEFSQAVRDLWWRSDLMW